jgi:hypothetical protein
MSSSDVEDDGVIAKKPLKDPFTPGPHANTHIMFDNIGLCPYTALATSVPDGTVKHRHVFSKPEAGGCVFARSGATGECPVSKQVVQPTKPVVQQPPFSLGGVASDLINSILDPLPAKGDRPFMPFNQGVLMIMYWSLYCALAVLGGLVYLTRDTPLQIHVAVMFFLCSCLLGTMHWLAIKIVDGMSNVRFVAVYTQEALMQGKRDQEAAPTHIDASKKDD